ncbi:MAG: periplasmic heavy metal sensor [Rickettsiales bacterium]|jgi:Spy/CpxP family protein refolding chaperone|nr:periplasmic heavy metal sensor [Rickettsiales bacterium]
MKRIYRDLRSTILVALIAFITCWVSNIWVFPAGRYHTNPDEWLKTQLNLTQEQHKKLEPVEQKYAQDRSALIVKIKQANQDLAKALVEEKQYSQRVQNASEHVEKLQAELKEVTLKHFFEMQPAMTPEQIQIMNQVAIHALSQHE